MTESSTLPDAAVADRKLAAPSPLARGLRSIRAVWKATVFFLKVFPMLPSRPIDWVTPQPVVEKVRYPSSDGPVEGEVYRPNGAGKYPGILVCLGVVPFGTDHPQVSVLGRALARAGFAALLYWSPHMRDLRLDPADLENIPLAYDWLIAQPYVDAARSGLMGTCVGGSFAMMAAAHPLVRDRVAFLSAYAPYASMWSFARDIASESRTLDGQRISWEVDQLTRKVFVHSITATLEPREAEALCAAFAVKREGPDAPPIPDAGTLTPEGQAVLGLLTAQDADAAGRALHNLPAEMQKRLTMMSPETYLEEIHAPLFVQLHDRGDMLIPVGESRDLHAALADRPGAYYTEMGFQHLDPVKGKLPLGTLVRELSRFFRAMLPLFRAAA